MPCNTVCWHIWETANASEAVRESRLGQTVVVYSSLPLSAGSSPSQGGNDRALPAVWGLLQLILIQHPSERRRGGGTCKAQQRGCGRLCGEGAAQGLLGLGSGPWWVRVARLGPVSCPSWALLQELFLNGKCLFRFILERGPFLCMQGKEKKN